MRKTIVAIAAIAASGCAATRPPAQPPDNTPLHPTAVIETHISSNGLKGMFPFESNERRYVRADMSREESSFKGTGSFSGFLVNMFGPGATAVIERPDRDLRWTLDLSKNQYTQCPLEGCARPAAAAAPQQHEQPQAKREAGCELRVARTHFSAKAGGPEQDVNGFKAREYRVAWIVTLRDRKGRSSTSTLRIDAWTTPLTREMREALHVERIYARNYARALHGRDGSRAREHPGALPPEVAKAMLGYIGQLSPRDRAEMLSVDRRLERVRGHPVRLRVDWDYQGDACAESKPAAAQSEESKSFLSGLGSMFSSKKDAGQKGGSEPLFSLTYDIKALKMENVHDGEFLVPKNSRRVKG